MNARRWPSLPDGGQLPGGLDFFREVTWKHEDECEQVTDERLSRLGAAAPQRLEHLGTVLCLLDVIASCMLGCRGGDHVIEYLIGRSESSARAAVRLARFGFYDEALALARGIGEIANLFLLFGINHAKFTEWCAADARVRKNKFKPADVRKSLVTLGAPVPIDEERYGRLCEVGTHVTPQTMPQAQNVLGLPSTGGVYQEVGVTLTLNEVGRAVAFVAAFAGRLAGLTDAERMDLEAAARQLLASLDGFDLLSADDYFARVRSTPEVRELQAHALKAQRRPPDGCAPERR